MKILKPNLQIAIDGPVAAGKGTISKLLAERLGVLYVDTGAMYRALAFFVHEQGIDFNEEQKICDALQEHKPEVSLHMPSEEEKDGRLVTVVLNEEDISWKIRTEEISQGVSIITRYKCVRDYMVPQQQALAQKTSVVMEGRDITTRVLPDADLKIYMDAAEKIRVKRRYNQLLEKGELITLKEVAKSLRERDYRDMHREIDPLTKSPEAWYLDTSNYSVTEVIDLICKELRERNLII
ncbi:MAG: (d)CMP kinase [Patescibacteria group bacterium]|jgi:cytidylate kinase